MTRYYADQFNDYGVNSHFTVTRSYKDIQTLYYYLLFTYKKEGVIVPPPPPKANLGFKDKCSTIGKTIVSERVSNKDTMTDVFYETLQKKDSERCMFIV